MRRPNAATHDPGAAPAGQPLASWSLLELLGAHGQDLVSHGDLAALAIDAHSLTPAMAAGVTDHAWEIGEIVDLLEG